MENSWHPWREAHARWRRVQDAYERLYQVHTVLRREEENFELLLGWGLLRWQEAGTAAAPVRRHLLVGRVALRFNAQNGSLTVEASADGLRLALEDDMLSPGEQPGEIYRKDCERLARETVERDGAPFWPTATSLADSLRTYVHALNQRGIYREELAPTTSSIDAPSVTYAPAIILRRRSGRSLFNLLEHVATQLTDGPAAEVPAHVRQLCEDAHPTSSGKETVDHNGYLPGDEEVLFPLPANDAQRDILEQVARRGSVLVQGPPGTGKSHTIANLVCHSLAAGRRVLVTSQTPRALKVLHDKIKEASPDVAQLCVSLLGDNANALGSLDATVRHITGRHQNWNARGNVEEENRLHTRLTRARKEVARLKGDIRQQREKETWQHVVAGGAYRGTAADIAKQVTEERSAHGWLEDAVGEPFREPPLGAPDAALLLALWRRLPPDYAREMTDHSWPKPDEVPDPKTFQEALDEEAVARATCAALNASREQPRLRPLLATEAGMVTTLMSALHGWRQARAAATSFGAVPGLNNAVVAVRSGQTRVWEVLADASGTALGGLLARARAADGRAVVLPAGERNWDELLADARDLGAHLADGRGFGLPLFRPAIVRRAGYLARETRVDGRPARTVEALAIVAEHLEVLLAVHRLRARWADVLSAPTQPTADLARQVAEIEEVDTALRAILALRVPLDVARAAIAHVAGLPEPDWDDPGAVGALLEDGRVALAERRLQTVTARLDDWHRTLDTASGRPRAHPIIAALRVALAARDFPAYVAAHETLATLRADADTLARRDELHARLAAVAPRLAVALAATFTNPSWDRHVIDFDAAWRWSAARTWLEAFLTRGDAPVLEGQLRGMQSEALRLTGDLAANRAWGHMLSRLTNAQNQHLRAWAQKMRGPKTGKQAERNRRDARRHLDACRDAVPAWIMPLHRVADSIEQPRPGMFDLLIIDEASQSGPEALALFHLAQQVIVVGDDEQISPTEIGLRQEDLDALAAQHLRDFPFRGALGLNSSVFGYADIRFAGRVLLREHFRCAPEIIRFSSDLCYGGELLPLRRQPPDRLSPPLVSRHIAAGHRQGTGASATNPAEAEALADALVACHRDPAYAGKTFGVVSLLAEAQAKLITRLLLKQLTPEEMEAREIVCGDAYAFQGDERDVMFLRTPNKMRISAFPGGGKLAIYGQAAVARGTLEGDRAVVAAFASTKGKELGAQTDPAPGGADGHPLRAQDRHCLGGPAPGDGLRQRHELLAAAGRLAASRGVGAPAPLVPGEAGRGGQDRLAPLPGGLLQRARPKRGAKTGPNPTDRARAGSKHRVLTDGGGIPMSLLLSAANVPDVNMMLALVDAAAPFVAAHRQRPRPAGRREDRLFADRAYHSQPHRAALRARGLLPVTGRRGQPHGSGLGKTRWPVERTLSWLHQFRRLRVRWEHRDDLHEALLTLGGALICARKL